MTQDTASTDANITPPEPPERAVMCGKCMYWKERPEDAAGANEIVGTCHLYAPVVSAVIDPATELVRVLSSFPTVPAGEWCGSFNDGEDDDDGEDEDEDEDDEQDDRPSYEELEAMLHGSLVACKRLQANLADIGDLVISDPAKCKRAHRSMPRLVFHKITDRDRELLASVFANFKVREEMEAEGRADAEAAELSEGKD